MAYIGNTVQTQGFAPAIDYFSGNGSTVTFTLSRPVASVAQMIVAIDNVIQNPSTAFTVAGNAITFSSAPLSGTNNIWVEYTSLITTYAAISQSPSVIGDITATGGYLASGNFNNSFIDGTIVDYVTGNGRVTVGPADGLTFYNGGTSARTAMGTFDASGNFTNNATGYTQVASGTTAQRPVSPTNGMVRYNSTLGYAEIYEGGVWQAILASSTSYSIDYLVVGGGGGGGEGHGGGGGAGGLLYGSQFVSSSTGYTVTIGAGGAASQTGANHNGNIGSNSVFGSITANYGGYGGGYANGGGNGGSGGGAGGSASSSAYGTGTAGQGYNGGGGDSVANSAGGGGGGATAIGTNGVASSPYGIGGNGGNGLNWQSLGTYYAGGGGAGSDTSHAGGTGGLGGGGTGAGSTPTNAVNGTANTGGGGGGGTAGGGGATRYGAAGGSGIVIVRYLGSTRGSGGTITSSGGYTYHTFTTSGTFTA